VVTQIAYKHICFAESRDLRTKDNFKETINLSICPKMSYSYGNNISQLIFMAREAADSHQSCPSL